MLHHILKDRKHLGTCGMNTDRVVELIECRSTSHRKTRELQDLTRVGSEIVNTTNSAVRLIYNDLHVTLWLFLTLLREIPLQRCERCTIDFDTVLKCEVLKRLGGVRIVPVFINSLRR